MNRILLLLLVSQIVWASSVGVDFECDKHSCHTFYIAGDSKDWELDSCLIKNNNGNIVCRFDEPEIMGGDGEATYLLPMKCPVGDSVWVEIYSNHGVWKTRKKMVNEVEYTEE
ncbi:MAG: hypothetical protein SPL52_13330 [Fibrobacter sp.]|nr:hypothetical protein [Fibrobacter sp.]